MDWQTATRLILERLDLRSEYAAFGVDITGSQPSATGWLACRVFGAIDADRNPSAGINVAGEGPVLGRYKEFTGDGRNVSFFEFAATIAGKFSDWKEARKHYAKQTGVKMPRGGCPASPADKLAFRPGRKHQIRAWCQTKPPITEWSAIAAGARVAGWPADSRKYTVIALPIFGPALADDEPTGWVIWNKTGRPLTVFQAKGAPPRQAKMLTITGSKSGWMNRFGVERLISAELVWKVEGPGDCLALQSVLPEALREKHVVITNGGGAQEGLSEEFWDHLAGKQVYIVHDCDTVGQAGGLKQARLAAAVAAEVRNITLPYEIAEKHGKDLRDWLNEGHTYQELLDLAVASPVIEPAEPSAVETVAEVPQGHDEQICLEIGIEVLGEKADGAIVLYSQNSVHVVPKIDALSYHRLVQIGGTVAREKVVRSTEADAIPPGCHHLDRVKEAVAILAGRCRLGDQTARGAGIWAAPDGRLVLVGSREAAIWHGDRLERVCRPRAAGLLLDLDTGQPWYDFGRLAADLDQAADTGWRRAAIDELSDLLGLWRWQSGPSTTSLLAGLVLAAWLQTIWRWRPHVAITSESSGGKSTLLEGLGALYGSLALISSRPSEAGLRQAIRHRACVVCVDEFESDRHRRGVLELLRTSGTGSRILRGTVTQGGIDFGLRHICWIAATELGIERQPDANRYLAFEILTPDQEARRAFRLPPQADLANLGQRLLAIAVRASGRALPLASELRNLPLEGVDGRTIESLAVPAAVFALGQEAAAREVMSHFAGIVRQSAGEEKEPDHIELMQAILSSHVALDKGERATVAQLLCHPSLYSGPADALERVGIAMVGNNSTPRGYISDATHVFFDYKAIQRYLLSGTRWAESSIDTYLMRLPTTKRDRRRLGSRNVRGITLLYSWFDEHFLGETESESGRSAFRDF